MAFSWLRNGGDPNYLLNGMILQMCVSKNRGTPKWTVKIMEKTLFLMDDLGGKNPYIWKHPCECNEVTLPPIIMEENGSVQDDRFLYRAICHFHDYIWEEGYTFSHGCILDNNS